MHFLLDGSTPNRFLIFSIETAIIIEIWNCNHGLIHYPDPSYFDFIFENCSLLGFKLKHIFLNIVLEKVCSWIAETMWILSYRMQRDHQWKTVWHMPHMYKKYRCISKLRHFISIRFYRRFYLYQILHINLNLSIRLFWLLICMEFSYRLSYVVRDLAWFSQNTRHSSSSVAGLKPPFHYRTTKLNLYNRKTIFGVPRYFTVPHIKTCSIHLKYEKNA